MKFLIFNFSRFARSGAARQFSNRAKGQAMLLTVLILGSSVLAASTIAGYLTLLKIRASSDTTNSAKAIFAADAGIEWELYKQFKNQPSHPKPTFTNGADFNSINESGFVKSIGQSGSVFRAFEANITGAPIP